MNKFNEPFWQFFIFCSFVWGIILLIGLYIIAFVVFCLPVWVAYGIWVALSVFIAYQTSKGLRE